MIQDRPPPPSLVEFCERILGAKLLPYQATLAAAIEAMPPEQRGKIAIVRVRLRPSDLLPPEA